jgi:hypothetical protein
MRTGAVAMFRADAASPPAPPPTLQDATLFSYQIGSTDTWRTEPWKADDTLAVITGDIVGDGQVLRLQRWNPDSGNIDPPVELVAGEALVSYVTPDGCYLFIHSERPARAGAGERQPWWLFSVVTGRQLAVLSYDFGARETCVLDAKVFYIVDAQPPGDADKKQIHQSTLKSLDIVSGAVVWQRPLTPRQTRTRPALRQ